MAQPRDHGRDAIDRRWPMGAAPFDLYDYAAGRATAKRERRGQQRLRITDEWPEVVPVTQAEVAIIEAYFGYVLDELFGPLP